MVGAGINCEQHRESSYSHEIYGGLTDKEIGRYSVICAMTEVAQVLWDHMGRRMKSDLEKGVVSRKAS